MKPTLLVLVVSSFMAGALFAGSSHKRPNLQAALTNANATFNKMVAAQKAQEFDSGGHAQKAKDLTEQALQELKDAVQATN